MVIKKAARKDAGRFLSIGNTKILFTLEYEAEKAEMSADIQYSGKYFDPMESDNMISVAIVKNLATGITHQYSDQEEYSNHITVRLK